MILEYAFSNVLKRRSDRQRQDGDRALPLEERLFAPLFIRLITHHGPRHLLILLFDGLLRKGQHFCSIVAFKGYALAVQVPYLTESLTRNGSRSCERCRCLHR